jgi:hypothetical protein
MYCYPDVTWDRMVAAVAVFIVRVALCSLQKGWFVLVVPITYHAALHYDQRLNHFVGRTAADLRL